jgi:hypothetical protein
MISIGPQYFVESAHGTIDITQNAQKGGLSGHDVEYESLGLLSSMAESYAIFVGSESLFETVGLEELGCLNRSYDTLSNFCLRTLICLKFLFLIKDYKNVPLTNKSGLEKKSKFSCYMS